MEARARDEWKISFEEPKTQRCDDDDDESKGLQKRWTFENKEKLFKL